MRVKIYQINTDRDKNRIKFESLDRLERFQGSSDIAPSIYDEVFNADIEETDLEDIYRLFNTEGHPLHRGHSLSISDVVMIYGDSENKCAYFCDSVGFRKVDFDEDLTHKPDNLMRVVYVEPNRPPFETEIEGTLEAEQKAVGGLISLIANGDGTGIISNDESKLMGMQGNRRIGDGSSIIAGPFFVCGLSAENFRSLTDEEVVKYMDRFAEPEQISQDEVQDDTGIIFISW